MSLSEAWKAAHLWIVHILHVFLSHIRNDNLLSGHWIGHSLALVVMFLILVSDDFILLVRSRKLRINLLIALSLLLVEAGDKVVDVGDLVLTAPGFARLLLLSL